MCYLRLTNILLLLRKMPIKCLLPLEYAVTLMARKKSTTYYSILCFWSLNGSSSQTHNAVISVVTVKDHEEHVNHHYGRLNCTIQRIQRTEEQHRLCFFCSPWQKKSPPPPVFTHTCLHSAESFVESSIFRKQNEVNLLFVKYNNFKLVY